MISFKNWLFEVGYTKVINTTNDPKPQAKRTSVPKNRVLSGSNPSVEPITGSIRNVNTAVELAAKNRKEMQNQ